MTQMKNWKNRFLTIAATLAVAATTASAETILKASVPFPFTAGVSRVMPAGDYIIRHRETFWSLESNETGRTDFAVPTSALQPAAGEQARLVFLCRAGHCSLSEIHAGVQEWGATFKERKPAASYAEELARIIIVNVTVSDSN
jgi:hypothetical protein